MTGLFADLTADLKPPGTPPPAAPVAAAPTPVGLGMFDDLTADIAPPPAPKPDTGGPGALTRGFVTGIRQGTPEALAGAAEMVGLDSVGKSLRDIAAGTPEQYRPKIPSVTDVPGEGVGDTVSRALTYAGEQAGQAAASTLPSLAAGALGAAGGAAVGGPVGAAVGGLGAAAVPSFALNAGDLYNALKEEGVPHERARNLAAGWAVPITGLDVTSLGTIASRFTGAAKKEAYRSLAKRMAREGGLGAVTEGGTEGVQQGIQEGVVSNETGKPINWASIADSAIAGALIGAPAGAASGIRSPRAPVETPPEPEQKPVLALPPPSTAYGQTFTARPGQPGEGQTVDPAEALRAQAEARRQNGPAPEAAPEPAAPLALPMPSNRDEQGNIRGEGFTMAPPEAPTIEDYREPRPLALPAPAPPPALPGPSQVPQIGYRTDTPVQGPGFTAGQPPQGTPQDRASYAVQRLDPGEPVTNRFLIQAAGLKADAEVQAVRKVLADAGLIEKTGPKWVRSALGTAPTPPAPTPPLAQSIPPVPLPQAAPRPEAARPEASAAAPPPAGPPPVPAGAVPVPAQTVSSAPAETPMQPAVSAPSSAIPAPAEPAPERPAITRRDIGPPETALTPAGREIPVRYAVVEADSLTPSQDAEGRANPLYPADLQPRDRSRGVSRQQIDEMSQRLKPALLDKSPKAGDGAPIVSADGIVESGNGRTLAIKQAYDRNLPGASVYRNYLAGKGYPVEGMKAPVLVRIRDGEMTPAERQAFTREANERDTLGLSATERAMADAAAIDDGMSSLYRGGDVDAAGNRPFVRAFISRVAGKNEAAGMIAADGSMSQEAVRRIEAALLAKAYGDADLVASMVESADGNVKAIGGALMDVAPTWAKMRADAASGQIDAGMDTTAQLLEAVKIVERARKDGRNVIEFVVQNDIFSGQAVNPLTENYLRLMFRDPQLSKPSGRDKMAEALRFYADQAGKSEAGAGLFGAEAKAQPADVLKVAREKQYGQAEDAQQSDIFRRPPGDGAGQRPAGGAGDRSPGPGVSPRARGPEPAKGGRPELEPAVNVEYPDDAHADLAAYGLRLANGGAPEASARRKILANFRGYGVIDGMSGAEGVDAAARDYAEAIVEESDRAKRQGEPSIDGWIVIEPEDQTRYVRDKKLSRFQRPSSSDTSAPTERTVSWQVAPDLTAEYVATPDYTAKRSEVADAVVDIARQMAPNKDLKINVADHLIGDGASVSGAYSRPSPLDSIISLALQDPAGKRRGMRDLIRTLNHEVVHFFRQTGLFTSQEWSILEKAAERNGWLDKYKIGERYADLSSESRIEEAVAEARADYAVGDLKVPPGVRGLFDRIGRFLDRVRNWMQGNGFSSWQDVMEKVGSGEVGSRESGRPGAPRGGTAMHAAWHGSPHDHDRFSTDKIGTGEGAQAYGWGLYFAGRKEVADFYRRKLSDYVKHTQDQVKEMFGVEISADEARAIRSASIEEGRPIGLSATMIYRQVSALRGASGGNTALGPHPELERLVEAVRAVKPGRLYQVDLAPAEDEYLDWDKAPWEQSRKVKTALRSLGFNTVQPGAVNILSRYQPKTGGAVYQLLVQRMLVENDRGGPKTPNFSGDKAASEALAAAGIPGIRYLDGSSRNKGDGTSNYVIFDDKHVSITAKFQKQAFSDQLKAERDVTVTPAQMDKARGSLYQKTEQKKGDAQQEAALKRIFAEEKPPLGQRILDNLRAFKDEARLGFRQGVVDFADAVRRAEVQVHGKVLDASVSAYKRMRMLNTAGVAHHLLTKGMVEWNAKDGVWQNRAGFEGGFNAIFEPLAEKGLLRLWEGWAVANRAKRLKAEGRENLLSDQDIDSLLKLGDQHPEFREVQKKWARFNAATLDIAEQSGLISAEARKVFERDDYVPFYRLLEDKAGGPRSRGGVAGQRSGIKTLTGGETAIADLTENMVRNFTHLLDASMKNNAAQAAVDVGVKAGMATPVPMAFQKIKIPPDRLASALEDMGVQVQGLTEAQRDAYAELWSVKAPTAPDVFSVMYDGKPRYYRANDPFFMRSMTALNWPGFKSWAVQVMGGAKNLLTRGITSFPDFMIRNALRDSVSSWVVTGGKTNPFAAAKGFVQGLGDNASVDAIRAAGADTAGWYAVRPDEVAAGMRRKDEGKGGRNAVGKIWDKWQQVGRATENANRIALYDRLKKDGASNAEAAFQAMDLMDFGLRGDNAAVLFLTTVVPFLNARLQGLYKLGRAASENPRAFALRGGMIMMASLALMAANWDDPDYDALPDSDKDTYYHIKAGDGWIRIPKPFEIGAIFSTVPERLIKALAGTEEGDKLASRLLRIAADQLAMDPTPQLVKPVIEQFANKSMFTGRPIETAEMQRLRPGQRAGETTSALAKGLGSLAPDTISPARVDHLLRGYFGTLGAAIMGASNAVADSLKEGEKPAMRAEDVPVVGWTVRGTSPALSTRYLTDFYDYRNKVQQLAASAKKLRQSGDAESIQEAQRIETETPGLYGAAKAGDAFGDAIATLRKQMRTIRDDPKMPGTEKRRKLDALIAQRNDLAKRGYRTLRRATGAEAPG